MRYGQLCNHPMLGPCIYWFELHTRRVAVVYAYTENNVVKLAPKFVNSEDLIEPNANMPSASIPSWARKHAVSRDWMVKYG